MPTWWLRLRGEVPGASCGRVMYIMTALLSSQAQNRPLPRLGMPKVARLQQPRGGCALACGAAPLFLDESEGSRAILRLIC